MVSKTVKIVLAVAVIVIVVFAAFAAVTYPTTAVGFSVSFTVGFDRQVKEFEVPFLHSVAQVEVSVVSGTALWRAQIETNGTTLWEHATAQGGMTTYTSEWIQLAPGRYNMTFGTVGLGSLDAEVTVTTKGGFW